MVNSKEKTRFPKRITAWPVPDHGTRDQYKKILALIGEVVAEWAKLDDRLILLLCHLVKCDEHIGTVIYHSLDSFSPRLAILLALAQHASDEGDYLLPVLHRLNDLHKKRNDLIHASYSIHVDYTKPKHKVSLRKVITRARRRTLRAEVAAQTSEIDTHLNLLYAATQFLMHYCGFFANRPSADKWRAIFLNTDSATSS